MGRSGSGHRAVPHTADVRIEAWAPTREQCIAEAVHGTVETFVDTSTVYAGTIRCAHVTASSDADLLVAVLDELVYLLDTAAEVVVDVDLQPTADGADARFSMAAVGDVEQIGAIPKAVSLHELRLDRGPLGWACSVTLDV